MAEFQAERSWYKQYELAAVLEERATRADLVPLEPWLSHRDRHMRGNVAYLFARLGDPRGMTTIEQILSDDSPDRVVEWQGGSFVHSNPDSNAEMEEYLRGPVALRAQIRSDRYYAVHLLGKLRDGRALRALMPLLKDSDIRHNVAWALGEIGDPRAVAGLIGALRDEDALVRTAAVKALAKLGAEEALPHIFALFEDAEVPRAGDQVSVGVMARKAVETIRAAR